MIVKRTHCKKGHVFTEECFEFTKDGRKRRRCKVCTHLYDISRPKRSPHKTRVSNRAARLQSLGWTVSLYDSVMLEQSGLCAICKRELDLSSTNKLLRANADHEHIDPPKPRGILCMSCNVGIGMFKDNIGTMRLAIEYLEKWK